MMVTDSEWGELAREVFLAELGYDLERGEEDEEDVEFIRTLNGDVIRAVRLA